MNRWAIATALVVFCLTGNSLAAAAKSKEKADWVTKIDKALGSKLRNVKIPGKSLADSLKEWGRWAGVTVVLDPTAAAAKKSVKIEKNK